MQERFGDSCVDSAEGVKMVWEASPLLDMKKELSDENEVIVFDLKH